MALMKSPTLTPAELAANCSNARKSTGPNTPAGKGRIVLNALNHRRYSRALRQNLIKAGADAELFDWIRSRIFDGFQPRSAPERWQAERLAREVCCRDWRAPQAPGAYRAPRQAGLRRLAGMSRASVWCLARTPWRLGGLETKPRYALKSADSCVTSPSRIPIRDRRTGRLARGACCLPGRWMRPAGFESKPICYLESSDARASLPMRISPDSEFDKPKLVHVNSYRQIMLRKPNFAEVGSVKDNLV